MSIINAPDFNELEGIYSTRFKTYTRSVQNNSVEEKLESDFADGSNQIVLDSMVFMEDSSIKTI